MKGNIFTTVEILKVLGMGWQGFKERYKSTQDEEDIKLSRKCRELGMDICQKINTDYYIIEEYENNKMESQS